MNPTLNQIMDTLLVLMMLGGAMTAFSRLDRWIAGAGYHKPYYAVHVVHNAAIVAMTLPDLVRCFGSLSMVTWYQPCHFAALLCYALHFYHIKDYWRSFHPDDWLHHGLMIGVALPLSLFVDSGALLGMNLFFTTGLPGGISYALLFAERNGWIERVTEKAINVPVHVWLRAPGCTAHAALTTATMLSSHSATSWQKAIGLLIAGLTYWNGQYFMQQVVAAASRQLTESQHISSRPEDAEADENSRDHSQDATSLQGNEDQGNEDQGNDDHEQ
jgi:hypothetical protein